MAIERHITAADHVFVGDDRTFEITVYEDDAATTPVNISGFELVWILRKTDKSPTALIEKSSVGSPAGIAITGTFNPDPNINTQRAVVTLSAQDSYSTGSPAGVQLAKKKYRYALKRVNDGARSTLTFGNFQFLQATTAAS